MRRRKFLTSSTLLVLLSFAIVACGGSGTASPTTGGTSGATATSGTSGATATTGTGGATATTGTGDTATATTTTGGATATTGTGGDTATATSGTGGVQGGSVSLMANWGGEEQTKFQASVAPFTQRTGIQMSYENTPELTTVLISRIEAGNPPDLAVLPNPGMLQQLAEANDLIPIDSFVDMAQLQQDYSQDWIDLGSANGTLYGVWFKGAVKSLVWYNPAQFSAKGYSVPTTWAELDALEQQIMADGATPWCVGIEAGSVTGWVGTDWVEDIMLRTAGPETYDKWVKHEIPWTDPAVKTAFERWGEIVLDEAMVSGGATAVLTSNFGEATTQGLFEDPPSCYLHRQASFVTSFFPQGVQAGTDYDFFPLPSIEAQHGTPALGAGDVVVMLKDTPQARELLKYLASTEPAEVWAGLGGFLSPNKSTSLESYADDLTRKQAEFLAQAETFRFDGSDLMPPAVGSGSFWRGVVDYLSGTDLDTVLQTIETSAQDAYK